MNSDDFASEYLKNRVALGILTGYVPLELHDTLRLRATAAGKLIEKLKARIEWLTEGWVNDPNGKPIKSFAIRLGDGTEICLQIDEKSEVVAQPHYGIEPGEGGIIRPAITHYRVTARELLHVSGARVDIDEVDGPRPPALSDRIAALEADNAALREQVAALTQELAGRAALWNSHFPASDEVASDLVTVASTNTGMSTGDLIDWNVAVAGHNRLKFIFDSVVAAKASVPPAPPTCLECGRPADVEVTADGHLRQLCWEHSGCKERYWLPDRWTCYQCGKAASAQATHGDGLTRPLCAWCAGTPPDDEEE